MRMYSGALTWLVMMMVMFTFGWGPITVQTASAHHGMDNSAPACGTYEVHLEDDYTKGRTDGMIYRVDHSVGCKRSILTGLVPAGIGEAQGNSWQMNNCAPFGQDHAVRNFNYYWHETINPNDVKVSCSNYHGPD